MARYPDLIEKTVELTNDGGYLRGEIAGVHFSEVVAARGQLYTNPRRYRVSHDDSLLSRRSYHIELPK